MEPYNFWQDLFDTYQSLSDWMKLAWLVAPLVFSLGMFAIYLRYCVARERAKRAAAGDLIYTICRDDFGRLHVFSHNRQLEQHPPIFLAEDRIALHNNDRRT